VKGLNPNDKIEDLYIESPPSYSKATGAQTQTACIMRLSVINSSSCRSAFDQPTKLTDRHFMASWLHGFIHGCLPFAPRRRAEAQQPPNVPPRASRLLPAPAGAGVCGCHCSTLAGHHVGPPCPPTAIACLQCLGGPSSCEPLPTPIGTHNERPRWC
jgi:hypothetical protein